jgi:hypothetical protein
MSIIHVKFSDNEMTKMRNELIAANEDKEYWQSVSDGELKEAYLKYLEELQWEKD